MSIKSKRREEGEKYSSDESAGYERQKEKENQRNLFEYRKEKKTQ